MLQTHTHKKGFLGGWKELTNYVYNFSWHNWSRSTDYRSQIRDDIKNNAKENKNEMDSIILQIPMLTKQFKWSCKTLREILEHSNVFKFFMMCLWCRKNCKPFLKLLLG